MHNSTQQTTEQQPKLTPYQKAKQSPSWKKIEEMINLISESTGLPPALAEKIVFTDKVAEIEMDRYTEYAQRFNGPELCRIRKVNGFRNLNLVKTKSIHHGASRRPASNWHFDQLLWYLENNFTGEHYLTVAFTCGRTVHSKESQTGKYDYSDIIAHIIHHTTTQNLICPVPGCNKVCQELDDMGRHIKVMHLAYSVGRCGQANVEHRVGASAYSGRVPIAEHFQTFLNPRLAPCKVPIYSGGHAIAHLSTCFNCRATCRCINRPGPHTLECHNTYDGCACDISDHLNLCPRGFPGRISCDHCDDILNDIGYFLHGNYCRIGSLVFRSDVDITEVEGYLTHPSGPSKKQYKTPTRAVSKAYQFWVRTNESRAQILHDVYALQINGLGDWDTSSEEDSDDDDIVILHEGMHQNQAQGLSHGPFVVPPEERISEECIRRAKAQGLFVSKEVEEAIIAACAKATETFARVDTATGSADRAFSKIDEVATEAEEVISIFNSPKKLFNLVTRIVSRFVMAYNMKWNLASSVAFVTDALLMLPGSDEFMELVGSKLSEWASAFMDWINGTDEGNVSQSSGESVLTGLISFFTTVLGYFVFKKMPGDDALKKVVTTVLTIGSISRGLKFTADGVFALAKACHDALIYLWYGVHPRTRELEEWLEGVTEWSTRVENLKAVYNVRKMKTDQDYQEAIKNAFGEGARFSRKLLGIHGISREATAAFGNFYNMIKNLMEKMDLAGRDATGFNAEPIVVLLSGESGVGKSTITPLLAAVLGKHALNKTSDPSTFVYNRNYEQEFWDGYAHQPICIYDDFGQVRDSMSKPNFEYMEVIRTGNTAPMNLHMANLEAKAHTPFTSKIILLTSNIAYLDPKSLTKPEAVRRRITKAFLVERNEDYTSPQISTEYNTFRAYDPTLPLSKQKIGEPISFDEMSLLVMKAHFHNKAKHAQSMEYREEKLASLDDKFTSAASAMREEADKLFAKPARGKAQGKGYNPFGNDWDSESEDEGTEMVSRADVEVHEVRDIEEEEGDDARRARLFLENHNRELAAIRKEQEEEKRLRAEEEAQRISWQTESVDSFATCSNGSDNYYKNKAPLLPESIVSKSEVWFKPILNEENRNSILAGNREFLIRKVNTFRESLLMEQLQKHKAFTYVSWNEDPSKMTDMVLTMHALNMFSAGFIKPDFLWIFKRLSVCSRTESREKETMEEEYLDLLDVFTFTVEQIPWNDLSNMEKLRSGFSYTWVNIKHQLATFTTRHPFIFFFGMGVLGYSVVKLVINMLSSKVETEPRISTRNNAEISNVQLVDHDHTGLERGSAVSHSHLCNNCKQIFSHVHRVRKNTKKVGSEFCPNCRDSVEIYNSGDSSTTRTATKVVSGAVAGMTTAAELFGSGDRNTTKTSNVKVRSEVFGSGDENTQSQTRVRMAAAQVASDVNCLEIRNKMLSNCYTMRNIHPTYGVSRIRGWFIKGRIFVTVRHFMDRVTLDSTITLSNRHQAQEYEIPAKAIDGKWWQIPDKDVVLIEMPNIVPAHPDMSKYLLSSSDHGKFSKFRGCLIMNSSDKEALMSFGDVRCHDSGLEYDDEGVMYKTRSYFSYEFETQNGDCGAPLFIISRDLPRKMVGMHVAGNLGVGYSLPLFEEEVKAVLAKIPIRAQIATPDVPLELLDAECKTPEGNFVPLGVLVKPALAANKSDIYPSSIYGKLTTPTTRPALLKDTVVDGVLLTPMATGLKKAGPVCVMLDKEIVDICANDVLQLLRRGVRIDMVRNLTDREMFTGIHGERYFPAIRLSTSAGYPYVYMTFGKPGKRAFISDDFIPVAMLLNDVKHREEEARHGRRVSTIWTDTYKDERRPHQKVLAGKTRIFSAGPVDYTLLFRKYFLALAAALEERRIDNEISVGTNPYSFDWERTKVKVLRYGDQVVAGDFSNYDGTLQIDILESMIEVINAWYDDGTENALIRHILWREIVNSVHLCGRNLYQWTHSQPSGCPITAILNSIYNIFAVRYVWMLLAREHAPDLATMIGFNANVSMVAYGDDNLIGISKRVVGWFNQITLAKAFSRIGMEYTDENKSGELVPYRSIADVAYLKRVFRYEPAVGKTVAPLNIETVFEMSNWVRGRLDKDQKTAENLANTIFELSLHGKEIYEEWAPKIMQVIVQADLGTRVPKWIELITARLSEMEKSFDQPQVPALAMAHSDSKRARPVNDDKLVRNGVSCGNLPAQRQQILNPPSVIPSQERNPASVEEYSLRVTDLPRKPKGKGHGSDQLISAQAGGVNLRTNNNENNNTTQVVSDGQQTTQVGESSQGFAQETAPGNAVSSVPTISQGMAEVPVVDTQIAMNHLQRADTQGWKALLETPFEAGSSDYTNTALVYKTVWDLMLLHKYFLLAREAFRFFQGVVCIRMTFITDIVTSGGAIVSRLPSNEDLDLDENFSMHDRSNSDFKLVDFRENNDIVIKMPWVSRAPVLATDTSDPGSAFGAFSIANIALRNPTANTTGKVFYQVWFEDVSLHVPRAQSGGKRLDYGLVKPAGNSTDEFETFLKHPHFLKHFSWPAAGGFNHVFHPHEVDSLKGRIVTGLFKTWSADIVYHFHCHKTPFHRGFVKFVLGDKFLEWNIAETSNFTIRRPNNGMLGQYGEADYAQAIVAFNRTKLLAPETVDDTVDFSVFVSFENVKVGYPIHRMHASTVVTAAPARAYAQCWDNAGSEGIHTLGARLDSPLVSSFSDFMQKIERTAGGQDAPSDAIAYPLNYLVDVSSTGSDPLRVMSRCFAFMRKPLPLKIKVGNCSVRQNINDTVADWKMAIPREFHSQLRITPKFQALTEVEGTASTGSFSDVVNVSSGDELTITAWDPLVANVPVVSPNVPSITSVDIDTPQYPTESGSDGSGALSSFPALTATTSWTPGTFDVLRPPTGLFYA